MNERVIERVYMVAENNIFLVTYNETLKLILFSERYHRDMLK